MGHLKHFEFFDILSVKQIYLFTMIILSMLRLLNYYQKQAIFPILQLVLIIPEWERFDFSYNDGLP